MINVIIAEHVSGVYKHTYQLLLVVLLFQDLRARMLSNANPSGRFSPVVDRKSVSTLLSERYYLSDCARSRRNGCGRYQKVFNVWIQMYEWKK